MAKTVKTSTSKPTTLLGHSEEQTRALEALKLAHHLAEDLSRFSAPAGILTDDCAGQYDDVLQAIDLIAETHFDGGLDFDEAFEERFSAEIKRLDKREQELYDLYVQECHAQALAGFALGVAWGRLQGGVR
jgi:hypothetical protein